MIVENIILRLKEAGTPFAFVEGANELAEVTDRPTNTPAAFVYISNEASGPNQRMTGPVLQQLATDVAIVIVTDNAGGHTNSVRDIEPLKWWVRGKLLGFHFTGADPLEHILGQIVQIKDGMVWFEDVFGTSVLLTEQP